MTSTTRAGRVETGQTMPGAGCAPGAHACAVGAPGVVGSTGVGVGRGVNGGLSGSRAALTGISCGRLARIPYARQW